VEPRKAKREKKERKKTIDKNKGANDKYYC
jgi:hypothetical protein